MPIAMTTALMIMATTITMAHDHAHDDHGHSHGVGGHHHAPADFGTAFAIGIALNTAYVAAEAFYGFIAHSVALLADAGHNLSDVAGLLAAWLAAWLSKRRPSGQYTYGLRRSSILAALMNAIVLLVVTGGIAWEAVRRLFEPEPSAGLVIVIVSLVGVAGEWLHRLAVHVRPERRPEHPRAPSCTWPRTPRSRSASALPAWSSC